MQLLHSKLRRNSPQNDPNAIQPRRTCSMQAKKDEDTREAQSWDEELEQRTQGKDPAERQKDAADQD
jgi:hypothetical protein